MATTLTGTNSYLVKSTLKDLTASFVKDYGDLALEKLDGSEATYEQIIGAVESLPFLAAKKMVVVQGLSLNKQANDELEKLVQQTSETTDLVIVESKLDKRGSYYKNLKKLTDFKEYNQLDEASTADWLLEEAKRQKTTLSKKDAYYLVQRVGVNQLKLSNELTKLVQYSDVVSRETIDLLTDENPSSTIFNLIDSVFSGNLAEALRIYDEQRKQRVEPQAIQGMLVWQMHVVSIVALAPAGASSNQIAKDSGISPFVVQKSQRIAKKMGRQKITKFMDLLRDIDYKSKHEVLDYDEALRYAIISLAD